jgi:hypothetical protein
MKKHHSITEPRGLLDSTDAPHETVLHHMFQTSFIISFVYSFKLLQGSQLFESLPSHFSKLKNLGAFSKTCYTMLHHATPLRNLGFFNPLTQPATAPHDKIHPGARLDIVSTMAPAAQMEHRTTHLSQAPGKSGKYRPWMIDEYNILYT